MKTTRPGSPLRLSASALALATIAGLAAPAMAEEAAPPAADAASPSMEEIIVTARKKDETLQEVPLTVTALGGATLEKYNVTKVADVVSRVPTLNVQVGGSGSGGQISLRGVGSSNISAAFDSAVAIDFDGVQISTMRIVQSGFFDTAQIEVLKGPQSLFFGKSASAGVLSLKSANPTSTWQAGGKAGYEFEEHGYLVNGYVSGPVTDTLGIRVAAQYNDATRYITLQPGPVYANGKYRGLRDFVGRVTAAWEPSDAFRANLKVQYNNSRGDGANGPGDVYCGKNGRADEVYLLGGAVAIPAGYDCKINGQPYYPDIAPALAAKLPTSGAPITSVAPYSKSDLWFSRLSMDLKLGDKFTLTSVTGYVDLNAFDVDNYSYAGLGPAFSLIPGVPLSAIAPALAASNGAGVQLGVGTGTPLNQTQQFTQELRLASKLDGPFNFMVGAFYEHRRSVFDTAQQILPISFIAPDPVTGFTSDYRKRIVTKGDAWSVFASANFDITDQLELSGGLRYTKEKRNQIIDVPYTHAFLAAAFVPSGFRAGPIRFDDDNFSPEVSLRYKINPDVNVYASYKTGFKSGGIDNSALPTLGLLNLNSSDPAVKAAAESSLKYKSETAKGGEIGIKSQLDNRTMTLNASAFYYVFKDLQVQNFDAVAIQFITLNAGEVTTKGAEVNWSWRTPVEGLALSANLAYTRAKFTKTFLSGLGQDLKGRDAPRAPHWAGNFAFDYAAPVSDALELGLSGNFTFTSSYLAAQDSNDDYKQDGYVTLDGSISIGAPGGRWKLALVGTNLTNKLWVNTAGGRPFLTPASAATASLPAGDDKVLTMNRGRQLFLEASFKF
ncbi:TonB-dependent receptor [Novosphingobium olei]|uniref:TonB-dependent receptor n=1 Tax=Novosphingobium olei TaxID=2728851 RepID=UPI00308BCCDC|nr:TonB-dependent receptor [Novosphingobium olei]